MSGQITNIDGRINFRPNANSPWRAVPAGGITMLLADNGVLPHNDLTQELYIVCSNYISEAEDDFAARVLTALYVLNPQKRRPVLNGTPLEWVTNP